LSREPGSCSMARIWPAVRRGKAMSCCGGTLLMSRTSAAPRKEIFLENGRAAPFASSTSGGAIQRSVRSQAPAGSRGAREQPARAATGRRRSGRRRAARTEQECIALSQARRTSPEPSRSLGQSLPLGAEPSRRQLRAPDKTRRRDAVRNIPIDPDRFVAPSPVEGALPDGAATSVGPAWRDLLDRADFRGRMTPNPPAGHPERSEGSGGRRYPPPRSFAALRMTIGKGWK
jgi:hypothetical protein